MIKKIMLVMLLSIGLSANTYVGIGGFITFGEVEYNVPTDDDCKAHIVGIVGYQFDTDYSVEVRGSHIMRGDAKYLDLYLKRNITDKFYGIIGAGKGFDVEHDDEYGANIGVGYNLLEGISAEIMYRSSLDMFVVNANYTF